MNQQPNKEELIDETLELLIEAYLLGIESGSSDINREFIPDPSEIFDSVFKPISGKTFRDRLEEYTNATDINRVIETETHRTYNEGQLAVAKKFNAKKTWVTMLDDRVRDAHIYLEGVTVGANEKFYVGDDSAYAPGGFESAELNVNCRCEIVLKE